MDFSPDDRIHEILLSSQHLKAEVDQAVKDIQELHRLFFQKINEKKSIPVSELFTGN